MNIRPSSAAPELTRRALIVKAGSLLTGAAVTGLVPSALHSMGTPLPASKRPPVADRKFRSSAVEAYIVSVERRIGDPVLAALFSNCFPNTLDTTVQPGTFAGKPDTAVITGDIAAMWLRDSSAQVWPYLALASADPALRRLLEGVIRRQTRCLLIDPYANSFMADLDAPPLVWSRSDRTTMKQGVGERKYELDSLCYPIRLSYGYWKQTGDTAPFDSAWKEAMRRVLATMRTEQRKEGPSPYRFERETSKPTDSLVNGVGNPLRPVGLIASAFRPSDDACALPFLIPANFFAVTSLRQLAEMGRQVLQDSAMANAAAGLADEVERALRQHAIVPTPNGTIWAYEIDGFGGQVLMDDANVPSLLSLPYLNSSPDAAIYARTRSFVWSDRNPWFFRGTAGEGIGGPHIGRDSIWPMSQIMFALTSESGQEIAASIQTLKRSATDGFMHESYNRNNAALFTRSWFAWANGLFGELIAKTAIGTPALLA